MKIRTIHGPVIGISKETYKPGKIQCEATGDGDYICDVPDEVGEVLLAAAFNADFVKIEEGGFPLIPEEPKAPEPPVQSSKGRR